MARYLKSRKGHQSHNDSRCNKKEHERDSILKVFKQRLKSPGARLSILQPVSAQVSPECTGIPIKLYDMDSSGDENTLRTSRKSTRKVKKWKSRSERNKHLSSKSKEADISAKETKEKTDFKLHIKMAHQVTNGNPGLNVKGITQNRLTRRLGLFNQGKASGTIGRDSFVLPESIQRQTETDIRRILGKRSPTMDTLPSTNCDILSSLGSNKIKSNVKTQENSAPKYHTGAIIKSQSPPEESMEVELSNPTSPSPLSSDFPDSPDIPAIAADLMRTFNARALMPERDLVKETTEQLQRLLKLNNPSPYKDGLVTPQNSTPSGHSYPQIMLRGTLSSETVSRGQGDGTWNQNSQPQPLGLVRRLGSGGQQSCVTSHVSGGGDMIHHTGQVTQSRDHVTHQGGHVINSENHVIQQTTSKFSAIKQFDNPSFLDVADLDFSPAHSMSTLEVQALSDARALLTLSELSQEIKENGDPDMFRYGAGGLMQPLYRQSYPPCGARQKRSPTNYNTNNHFSLTVTQPHLSMPYNATHARPSHQLTFLDDQCTDFYIRHGQTVQHSQALQESDCLDILEEMDRDSQSQAMFESGAQLARAPMSGAQSARAPMSRRRRRKQNLMRSISPDCDGSPAWFHSIPTLPHKPENTPSPTIKLYPRRVF